MLFQKNVLVCAVAVFQLFGSRLEAKEYPTAPVKVFCGFSPGGSTDTAARLAAKWLSEELKQPFVVENRVGANGLVSIQALKSSKPDGYTLMMATAGSLTIAPAVLRDPKYKIEDFTPIAIVGWYPYALVSRPSFPANDVAGLIDYAKKNPGQVTYGSAGNGSTNHLAGEWFSKLTSTSMVHVAYKGDAPAVADLLGNRVDVYFITPSIARSYIQTKKLKLLGSTAAAPSPLIEGETRMVSATVPGFQIGSWLGLVGPAGMPRETVLRLNKIINDAMQRPDAQAEMRAAGLARVLIGPDEFQERISQEFKQWKKIAQESKIEIE